MRFPRRCTGSHAAGLLFRDNHMGPAIKLSGSLGPLCFSLHSRESKRTRPDCLSIYRGPPPHLKFVICDYPSPTPICACVSQVSPSTMWVLGVELRSSALVASTSNQLNHLSGPWVLLFYVLNLNTYHMQQLGQDWFSPTSVFSIFSKSM